MPTLTKQINMGPNGTAVSGLTALTDLAISPLNYDADFRVLEEGPSRVVMTDVTSPIDQPSTLRIAQTSRANIYAGTDIDPSAFLATRKGSDTIVEFREVWEETDSVDATYRALIPVRCAITLTLPVSASVTPGMVQDLITRTFSALYEQGDALSVDGITDLLHGVVKRV